MSFSAVGSIISAVDGTSTFSLTPAAVGDFILFEATEGSTVVATAMSSSNVTWTKLGSSFTGTVNPYTAQVFLGTVTAASTATVTISWSGTPAFPQGAGQEFSSTKGAASVTLNVQGHIDSAGTNTWASLTPTHGAGELYFGYSFNTGNASPGSTSGYVYQLDPDSNGMAYDVNCTTAAQAPVWADSGQQLGIMVLVYEAGGAAAPPYFGSRQPVRTRIPARYRLAGVYSGVSPKDTSFGTGQVQWNAGGPVRNPAPGPVFHARPFPCRAPVPQNRPGGFYNGFGTDSTQASGRVMWSPGAPVSNPSASGPVFRQRTSPVRFVLPPPHPRAGRIGSSFGAPVQNPIHGPPAYPLQGPVQARFPQLHPRAGRVESASGAPVRNPVPGPVFVQADQALRAKLPLQPLLRGRVSARSGAPVQNPTPGPAFYPAVQALRARLPLQPLLRGRSAANPGAPVRNPTPGPVFHPAVQALRARLPLQPLLRGRSAANAGAPVHNPVPGPVFRQAARPAQARFPLPPRGRIGSDPGIVVPGHAPAPVYPARTVRAQPGQRPGLIYASVTPTLAVATPGITRYNTGTTAGSGSSATSQTLTIPAGVLPGDVILLLVQAFREDGGTTAIEVPSTGTSLSQIGSAGHTASGEFVTDAAIFQCTAGPGDPGAVITAQGSGSPSVFWSLALVSYTGFSNAAPVDVSGGAANTLTCPSETTGVSGDWAVYFIATSSGSANTLSGATVRQDTHPSSVDAAIADSNGSAGPSGTGIGGGTWTQGPASFGVTFTVGLAPAVTYSASASYASSFSTGRISFTYGAQVQNPLAGGPAPVLHSPVRARLFPPRAGRIAVFRAPPAVAPPAPVASRIYPLPPLRAKLPQQPLLRGRIYSDPGAPVSNPNVPAVPAQQVGQPAGIRVIYLATGRTLSSRTTATAPAPPSAGPVFHLADSPIRARIPRNAPRGRVYSNAGAPYIPRTPGPRFHPADSPVRARVPQDGPRGRVYSGKGAPVHNPVPGPVFRQATTPSRARITLPPRGRTAANPGTLPPAVSAYGLFNIVIPYGVPFGGAAFPLPAPKVAISGEIVPGEIGPLSVTLPKPQTSLSGDVLHQPLALTLPLPVTSLSGVVQYGLLSVVLPAPHVTLNTGILDHAGDFAIVFNVMPMGFGLLVTRPEKAPRFRAGDEYGSADFTTGTPFAGWSTGTPQTGWSTGNPS